MGEGIQALWNLTNIAPTQDCSIFYCTSKKHGPCVLKRSKPAEVATAYHALREYSGTRYCEVYEADIAGGVLLLERIVPGTTLRVEPDRDWRLGVFGDVWRDLHKPPAEKSIYSTYMGWVSRITEYMRCRRDYELLCAKMAKAEQICRSLCEKYPGEMLLHGDLHHYNILLGNEGRWRVIDPKGVVGDPVFDIPRFILNEFADGYNESLPRVIQILSDKLNIPQGDLMRLTFVETCMAHCWVAESVQEPNVGQVLLLEAMMEGEPS